MLASQHATEVFLRLPEEKQKKIFDAAAAEFAAHGFEGANTNTIARRAGISVGSLFQYFRTKQALVMALADYGSHTLLTPVIEAVRDAPDVLSLFRSMLCFSREFALEYPHYNRVYLELTSQPTAAELSTQLTRRIEGRTIASYRRAMRKTALDSSEIEAGCAAFLLDNLVLAFQFSFVSTYYRDRLIAYTGLDPQTEGDALIDALCALAGRLLN